MPAEDKLSVWSEAEFIEFGRRCGLVGIPANYRVDISTARDPATDSVIRFASTRVGDREIWFGAVSMTREMRDDCLPPRDVEVDAAIRACLWYGEQLLSLGEDIPEDALAFLGFLRPRRLGEIYDPQNFGGSPVDLETINTVDDLMKWAAFEVKPHYALLRHPDRPGEYFPTGLTYQRQLVVCGNGDPAPAIAQMCRECALVAAGFRVANGGGMWRIPPEVDVRDDIFGRLTVSFYARIMVVPAPQVAAPLHRVL